MLEPTRAGYDERFIGSSDESIQRPVVCCLVVVPSLPVRMSRLFGCIRTAASPDLRICGQLEELLTNIDMSGISPCRQDPTMGLVHEGLLKVAQSCPEGWPSSAGRVAQTPPEQWLPQSGMVAQNGPVYPH